MPGQRTIRTLGLCVSAFAALGAVLGPVLGTAWPIPVALLAVALTGLLPWMHAHALRSARARFADIRSDTLQAGLAAAEPAVVRAIWRAVLRESALPLLLAVALLVTETSLLAKANAWLAALSHDKALSDALHLPTAAGLSALILATLKAFWTRARRRIALTGAIATELLAGARLAGPAVDFAAVRKAFLRRDAGRPIAVASARPYLFLAPSREILVDLPPELLDPLIRLLDLEHALGLAWEKFDSDSFMAATQARRKTYIGHVEALWAAYAAEAPDALLRVAFYCALRRWLPL